MEDLSSGLGDRGRYLLMKLLLPILILFLIAGCVEQSKIVPMETNQSAISRADTYSVLVAPPDAVLDEMQSKFAGINEKWRNEWREATEAIAIDGQRTVTLLEIACYADVMCHTIEYPLRVATHDYIRDNLANPDVRKSLDWIASSYHSDLPARSPGDEEGVFDGVLIKSMEARMTEYANQLLKPNDTGGDRK